MISDEWEPSAEFPSSIEDRMYYDTLKDVCEFIQGPVGDNEVIVEPIDNAEAGTESDEMFRQVEHMVANFMINCKEDEDDESYVERLITKIASNCTRHSNS